MDCNCKWKSIRQLQTARVLKTYFIDYLLSKYVVYIEACQVHYVFCAIFCGIFGHLKWVSSPIVVLDLKNWDLTRLLRRTFIVDNSVNFALFQLLKQFIKVTHGWSDIHCPLKSRNRLEHQVYFSRSMRFKKKKKTRHVNRIPLLWKKRNSSPSLKSI